jgi:anti-sigma factor RsiW
VQDRLQTGAPFDHAAMTIDQTQDPEWLTCRELVELVTHYFDGALPPEERLRFEEHVAVCPPCRIHLNQMRETVRLLGTLDEEHVPAAARDSLLHAFRDWKRSG